MIDDPKVRSIIITGPHNIGKTRLALETSFHRFTNTVVAVDPRSMSVSDLLDIESPDLEIFVIIEDPEPGMAERFVNQALSNRRLKLLITLSTTEKAPTPSFGQDDRVG